jgi:hypothetical protein
MNGSSYPINYTNYIIYTPWAIWAIPLGNLTKNTHIAAKRKEK